MADRAQLRQASPLHAGLIVLMPIYNDWDAVSLLLAHLDRVLDQAGLNPCVLLVDDGSNIPVGLAIGSHDYVAIKRIEVLALRRNMGHQRAIAIALAFAHDRMNPTAVLVMDGDGEDAPEDVPRLVARLSEGGDGKVIFAERRRRSESLSFRAFYTLYRLAHLLLTGIPVRVGNFSIVPSAQLTRLVVVSELWNHYAASVFMAKLPRDTIPTVRARRLSGHSRLNFVALVAHGLSALSVHAELIGVRLLVVTGGLVALAGVLLGAVVGIRVSTSLAIPGWATSAAGLLIVLLFQATGFAVFFAFLVLHARSQPLFIPIRDYPYFIDGLKTLFLRRTDEHVTPGFPDAHGHS